MSQQNIETISALYEAFTRRDQTSIIGAVDPQITVSQTGQLPWGGSFQGLEGLGDFFTKLLHHIDSRVEIDEYFSAGEQVVAIGRTVGEVRGSGARFAVRVVHVWTVKEGKATRFEPYIDTPAMLQALAGG